RGLLPARLPRSGTRRRPERGRRAGLRPRQSLRGPRRRRAGSRGDRRRPGRAEPLVFLNILVAVNGTPSSKRALEHAVDLARALNSMLTLVVVAPHAAQSAAVAGVSNERMTKELDDWAKRVLAEAASAVPEDVIAHTVQRVGDAGPEIVTELDRGG